MYKSMRYVTLLSAVFMALHSLCLAEDLTAAQAKGNIFTGEIRLVGNGAAWSWACKEYTVALDGLTLK